MGVKNGDFIIKRFDFTAFHVNNFLVFFSLFFKLFLFVVGAGLRAQKRRIDTGEQGMIGAVGIAFSTLNPAGQVKVQGELWNAESIEGTIAKDTRIVVTEIHGLSLKVKKA